MSLTTLPPEILSSILKQLTRAEVSSVSKTCKPLQNQVLPHLYRNVHLGLFELDGYWEEFPVSIVLLFRTVYTKADRAALIKHISFKHPLVGVRYASEFDDKILKYRPEGSQVQSRITEMDIGNALTCMKDLVPPSIDCTLWARRIRMGRIESWMALLLSRLHQLESLDIEHGHLLTNVTFPESLVSFPSGFNPENMSHFQSLRKVVIHRLRRYVEEWSASLQPAYPIDWLLALPCIEEIETATLETVVPYSLPSNLPICSSLTTLILRRCNTRFNRLGMILQSTPNLQVLQYDFVEDLEYLDVGHYPAESWSQLNLALQHVKQSLRSLKISVDWWDPTINYQLQHIRDCPVTYWNARGAIGSLTCFSNLHTLDIPIVVLLGWNADKAPKLSDVLPATIRDLSLRDDLCFYPEYQWMRQAEIHPRPDAADFDAAKSMSYLPDLILNHLEDYLSQEAPLTTPLSSIAIWQYCAIPWGNDNHYVQKFRSMSVKANVKAKIIVNIWSNNLSGYNDDPLQSVDEVIRAAMTPDEFRRNFYYDKWQSPFDSVKEIIIHDPLGRRHLDARNIVRAIKVTPRIRQDLRGLYTMI